MATDEEILQAGIQRYGRERPLATVTFTFVNGGKLASVFGLAQLLPGDGCNFQILCEDYDKQTLLRRITHPYLYGRVGEG